MIIPNLLVTDLGRSIAFYRDSLDMTLTMAISKEREILMENEGGKGVFAILEWNGSQLMLQTAASLATELPGFTADQTPGASGTIYFRDRDPREILDRIPEEQVIKGPLQQWYGMTEVYFHDPDGYVICVGMPEGPPPGP